MPILLRAILSSVCLFALVGCIKKPVTATCQPGAPSIEGFSGTSFGGLGYLNNAGDAIGNVYILAPVPGTKSDYRAELAGSISGTVKTAPSGNETANVSTEWDLSGSGGLNNTEIATVQSKITHTISVQLVNVSQKQIDVLSSLGDSANSAIKQRILAHPNDVFMIINPMLSGDKGSISAAQGVDTKASIRLTWYANAEVDYKCSSDIVRSKVDQSGPTDLIGQVEFVQSDLSGNIFFVGGMQAHVEQIMVGNVTPSTNHQNRGSFSPKKIIFAPKKT